MASGDVAEARRLYGELAASDAPPAVRADALAVLAAAHGLRHEAGVEVCVSPKACTDLPSQACRCSTVDMQSTRHAVVPLLSLQP